MGTNFYARIILKEEDIKRVHRIIDGYLTGNTLEIDDDILKDAVQKIHLGKRSSGWQFLWQANPKYYQDNLESIKEFLSRDDVIIYNEYEERFTLEKFLDKEIGYCLYNDPEYFMNDRQYAEKHNESFDDFGEWTTEDGLRFVKGDFR